MLLSVIVPVFNGEHFLPEAIASVRAQNYAPLEIIVVDDGSTDGTAEVVRTLGSNIRYLHQFNAGAAAARNRALKIAAGDIISFLDADDLWPNNKLALQLPIFRQDNAVQLVLGKTQRLWPIENGAGGVLFEPRTPPWGELLLGCALCRRSLFEQIGMFDPTLRIGEDTDWFFRARMVDVPTVWLEQVTLFYRRHQNSLTYGVDHTKSTIFPVLKRALQRQRHSHDTPAAEEGGRSSDAAGNNEQWPGERQSG